MLTGHVGDALGMDAAAAAWGVTEVVDKTMANAARVHAVENGEDLSEYTMIAFGGAAPLHAARLCEKLGIDRCLVPVGAGVGSAIGFLMQFEGLEFRDAVEDLAHLAGLRQLELLGDDGAVTSHGRAVAGLRAAGHEVTVLDLYAEGFRTAMSAEERAAYHGEEPILDPMVQRHADEVLAADGAIRGVVVPGGAGASRKDLDRWTGWAKSAGAGGLIWVKTVDMK